MPYATPLALLVAVLDLIPLVGATLGGALLVIVRLFVEPWKAVVLLIFVLVYQQVESNFLQPMVYSKAVQLNGLVIPDRPAGWRTAAGHPRCVAGYPDS
jgi:predicted PurR-regulated permease PerM